MELWLLSCKGYRVPDGLFVLAERAVTLELTWKILN